MDYMRNAEKRYVDGRELCFIRCDKDGNEISPERLSELNFTNTTIQKLVTETAGRLKGDSEENGGFTVGFTSM